MNRTSSPQAPAASASQLTDFMQFCETRTGQRFPDQGAFHEFSVSDHRRFWSLFLQWSDLLHEGDSEVVCTDDRCEQATFFPNLRLSYAENLLRIDSPEDGERIALVARHGSGPVQRITRRELRDQVRRLASRLRGLGVGEHDRVAAIAGNNAEIVIGALATATVGATFSSAAPDMGAAAILSRFEQLAPKILMANLEGDGVGGPTSMTERVGAVAGALPSLSAVIALDAGTTPDGLTVPVHRLADLLASPEDGEGGDEWVRFPFNHPLFILFSSGTTGPPKCIVHGAGGTLLEHLKEHRLHVDLGRSDKLFFHTSAAWMMWNWQLSALASGGEIILFDGPLAGPQTLWELVASEKVSVFGTSPPFLQLCEDSGYSPRRRLSLTELRAVLSTGAVLHDWQYDWVLEEVGPVPLQSISGGTDIIGCFVLGSPNLPVHRGKIQCRSLGFDVQAMPTPETPSGSDVGELVCRNPFPSRPLGFLGDEGERFHDAYFAQNPGVWTHGDLIEFDSEGGARIHGRSDGVLNIQGVRLGPADIYRALRDVAEVREAMAVEGRGGVSSEPRIVLLVVLHDGAVLDGRLIVRIRQVIARYATSLHVPELVVAVDELPLTHSGKRSEKAGRDAVNGVAPSNIRALKNPGSVEQIGDAVARAEEMRGSEPGTELPADASTEVRLVAIWEAALGVEPLQPEDNFFEVGGTSLLAVRIFYSIQQQMGVELPLSTLLEAPTIAKLASVIDDPEKHVDPLVVLRDEEGNQPLFLVHSIWGDVLDMRPLALRLEAGTPVYGVRARGLDPRQEPQVSVEEMAATYIEAMRTVQPTGPYRIAGHSFAGLVAFEIARQLSEAGEEIGWLGLFDAEVHPNSFPRLERWRHRAIRLFNLARLGLVEPRTTIAFVVQWTALRGAPWAPRAAPSNSDRQTAYPPRRRRLARICIAAGASYRPGPYTGGASYFLPEVRRLDKYSDPTIPWKRVMHGELTVETVPGEHIDMVREPNVGMLASRVDAHLEGGSAGAS